MNRSSRTADADAVALPASSAVAPLAATMREVSGAGNGMSMVWPMGTVMTR